MEVVKTDEYTKGMAHWDDKFDNNTLAWDQFQFVQFKKYLHGNILELGSGFGRMSRLTCNEINFNSLTLSEPSPLFFGLLSKNFEGVKKVTVSNELVEELAVKRPGEFDVVYSVHVLEHIENDKNFMEKSLELLKPGGFLIVSVPALNFLYSNLDKEIGHYRRYDKKMLSTLIKDMNVTIVAHKYSDLLGVLGSFLMSRVGKTNYQNSSDRKSFIQLASIYSKFIVPISRFLERLASPPIGLNLTLVVKKKG